MYKTASVSTAWFNQVWNVVLSQKVKSLTTHQIPKMPQHRRKIQGARMSHHCKFTSVTSCEAYLYTASWFQVAVWPTSFDFIECIYFLPICLIFTPKVSLLIPGSSIVRSSKAKPADSQCPRCTQVWGRKNMSCNRHFTETVGWESLTGSKTSACPHSLSPSSVFGCQAGPWPRAGSYLAQVPLMLSVKHQEQMYVLYRCIVYLTDS